ncbi:uncharacterized protein EDB91DRAFT_1047118 [Suillus paluster]|uniref:uncharacterized protein n=1 Tax=Suillus paluster TaxID=48578 RepID=UPI001B87BCE9|nr:uncharacterized protein EDB91DRAFT_1047118 [Suillus paluster]KAG1750007.1 hypothetical protein EDB91DRAFT_1047118 [Suillus paluster]
MGSLCSRASAHSGGHQVLGSTAAQSNGQNYGTTSAPDPRAAAAEAAERRLKTAQARGTNTSNPNRGRLAGQVETAKAAKPEPTPREEERLVVCQVLSPILYRSSLSLTFSGIE